MRSLIFIAALSLVSACATPSIPLSEQKANYPRLDLGVIETDDEIIISLEQPAADPTMAPVMLPPGTSVGQAAAAGAAAGLFAGLIMAGIESAERADARKDILPVQEALGEIRFGPSLREALVESLRKLDWTEIEDVEAIDLSEEDAVRNFLTSADTPGVMTLATSNFLSRNASTLVFAARVTIIPKPTEVTRGGKPRIPPASFVTTVGFEVPSPVSGDRRVDFLPAWAEDDAELIRAAAAQAEPILAELILRQLSEGNIPVQKRADGKWERRSVHLFGTPIRYKVQVLEQRPDGDLVRVEGGMLRFLASSIAPLEESEPALPDADMPEEAQPAAEPSDESIDDIPVSAGG